MLPSINKNQEIVEHLKINPKDKVLKSQQKKVWTDQHILLGISTPEIINNPKSKKIFKLRFTYKKKAESKKHSHVIYFGDKQDYIFTKNANERVRKILKYKNIDNPFHSDYWSAHLANKYQTLKQGLEQFTLFFINQNKEVLKEKEEKIIKTNFTG